jgi:hypothetical protein
VFDAVIQGGSLGLALFIGYRVLRLVLPFVFTWWLVRHYEDRSPDEIATLVEALCRRLRL